MTVLSGMDEKQYKEYAILGGCNTGKQVAHLLKSNKLWCHLVEHKSYLKVYLQDWISALRGHTVHNHEKTVSHLAWEPDMNKLKKLLNSYFTLHTKISEWVSLLVGSELLQLHSLVTHLIHCDLTSLTASLYSQTLLTKFTKSLLRSLQPHLHSPLSTEAHFTHCKLTLLTRSSACSPRTPWVHHKLTLLTYSSLHSHCSLWTDSLLAHCSSPVYNAYYIHLFHPANLANHELTSLTMLTTNSPHSLQAKWVHLTWCELTSLTLSSLVASPNHHQLIVSSSHPPLAHLQLAIATLLNTHTSLIMLTSLTMSSPCSSHSQHSPQAYCEVGTHSCSLSHYKLTAFTSLTASSLCSSLPHPVH